MRWIIVPLMVLLLLLSGCLEGEQIFTLNPDGSGKVSVEFTAPLQRPIGPVPANTLPRSASQRAEDAVVDLLNYAEGVEAWKDVSYRVTDDGRLYFEGVAYFPNLSKLDLFAALDADPTPTFKRLDEGVQVGVAPGKLRPFVILHHMNQDKAGVRSRRLDGVVEQQRMYKQVRPMFESVLEEQPLRWTMTFHLPGRVHQTNIFQRIDHDSVRITYDGSEILEAVDELMQDKQELREHGNVYREPPIDWLRREVFGEEGPIRVATVDWVKPQFDYEAEAAAAKETFPEMVEELGLRRVVIPAGDDMKFKDLRVGGVQIVEADSSGVAPLSYRGAGYYLALIGMLSKPVVERVEGQLTKAVAEDGQDLLPDGPINRSIGDSRIVRYGPMLTFTVPMKLPAPDADKIKEIAGWLVCIVSKGTEEVEIGPLLLKEGAEGEKLGARITEVTEYGLRLRIETDPRSIEDITFFNSDGEEIALGKWGYQISGGWIERGYRMDQPLPKKIKIVIGRYIDPRYLRVPFRMKDIPLVELSAAWRQK